MDGVASYSATIARLSLALHKTPQEIRDMSLDDVALIDKAMEISELKKNQGNQ